MAIRALYRMIRHGRSFSGRERNCCFLNVRGGRFADVSSISGLDYPDDARAIACTDWDHDGDVDLWIANRSAPVVRLLLNDAAGDRHFLALRLVGKTCNRDAIGARIVVRMAGDSAATLTRTLRGGDGFLSQSSKWVHVGLGGDTKIASLVVHWPGGEPERFSQVEVDRRLVLVQGTGTAIRWNKPRRDVHLTESKQSIPPDTHRARIVLTDRLPLPRLKYRTPQGKPARVGDLLGKPLLVNLWASSCRPCLVELKELMANRGAIEMQQLRVLALSVDELGKAAEDAEGHVRIDWNLTSPFEAGAATAELIDKLQLLHNVAIERHRELPLPSSFLIDSAGRVAVIYKGAVNVEQLLEDVRSLTSVDPSELAMRGLPLSGRWHQQAQLNTPHRLGDLFRQQRFSSDAEAYYRIALQAQPDSFWARYHLAATLVEQGLLADAEAEYRRVLQMRPEDADVLFNLGVVCRKQDKAGQAAAFFRKSIARSPQHLSARLNLGETLLALGKPAEAVVEFRHAVDLRPDSAAAHNALGIALAGDAKSIEAMEAFRQAVAIDPSHTGAHNNLARALAMRGDLSEAADAYRALLRIAPKFPHASENLRRVEAQLDRPPKGVQPRNSSPSQSSANQ